MKRQVTHLMRLTPSGQGAVATLLLAGHDALSILNRSITPPIVMSSGNTSVQHPRFARFSLFSTTDDRQSYHEEVVLDVRDHEKIEIHCHGGETVVAAVEEELIRSGAQKTDCACSNLDEKRSKIQHEAFQLFLQAETERTSQILWSQYLGKLNIELKTILAAVRENSLFDGLKRLEQLVKTAVIHLVEPFKIALVGPVNVGKSSLLNAMIGFERAIVTPVPGTTRDLVSCKTIWDGWPLLLIDTAGIRETNNRIEQLGMELAQSVVDQVDLVLEICDFAQRESQACETDRPVLTVCNKIDLAKRSDFRNAEDIFYVSAKTGEGIEPLLEGITKQLLPYPPQIGDPVLFTHDQRTTVQKIRTSLGSGDVHEAIMLLEQMLS